MLETSDTALPMVVDRLCLSERPVTLAVARG